MDTSKEYIKMCEKAEEIQKEYKPKLGDIAIKVYRKDTIGDVGVVCTRDRYSDGDYFLADIINNGEDGTSFCFPPKKYYDSCIWLPRQDQLQWMIIKMDLPKPIAGLIWDFSSFADPSEDVYNYCNSMEQLWLAFVMKEKYNKSWNGEGWIKR